MPRSKMTVGRTKEMPHPPMPCNAQMKRNGTNVGSANRSLICWKLNVLEFIDGAWAGRSWRTSSRSDSVRNVEVSG